MANFDVRSTGAMGFSHQHGDGQYVAAPQLPSTSPTSLQLEPGDIRDTFAQFNPVFATSEPVPEKPEETDLRTKLTQGARQALQRARELIRKYVPPKGGTPEPEGALQE